MKAILNFIGIVHSPLKSTEDCPRQENENAPPAELVIYPEFSEAIKDIQGGEEMLLLTWLHAADRNMLACKPRNDESASLTGVFSTRSPDRPNPVGIHIIKIISAENNILTVANLEVLDETPLIDIKPLWKKDRMIK